jgi:hypothetical protein
MRLVVMPEPGVTELAWMWMPTFIGLNNMLKKEIEVEISKWLVGKLATDDVLDAAHDKVIEIVCEKFPLPGLRDYLDALKFVEG